MADARFFKNTGPYSLAQIAAASECVLAEGVDPHRIIHDVASLDTAGPYDLSFLDNPKYAHAFTQSRAGACIINPLMASKAPAGTALLLSEAPYRSYALAATLFYPHSHAGDIHPQAQIHATATLAPGVSVGAFSVIGPGVSVGEGTWIGPNVTVTHADIGKFCRLYTGVRVGQEGFGFAIGPKGVVPVPQLGRVIIGDHCHIGANTCIDRGAASDTVIGAGCILDNLVHIAHNVVLGKGCVIAGQTGISGSTVVGDYTVMGGQVGIAGHLHIGRMVRIAAQSGVTKDIPDGQEWVGFPASPRREYWKFQAGLKKLLSKSSPSG